MLRCAPGVLALRNLLVGVVGPAGILCDCPNFYRLMATDPSAIRVRPSATLCAPRADFRRLVLRSLDGANGRCTRCGGGTIGRAALRCPQRSSALEARRMRRAVGDDLRGLQQQPHGYRCGCIRQIRWRSGWRCHQRLWRKHHDEHWPRRRQSQPRDFSDRCLKHAARCCRRRCGPSRRSGCDEHRRLRAGLRCQPRWRAREVLLVARGAAGPVDRPTRGGCGCRIGHRCGASLSCQRFAGLGTRLRRGRLHAIPNLRRRARRRRDERPSPVLLHGRAALRPLD